LGLEKSEGGGRIAGGLKRWGRYEMGGETWVVGRFAGEGRAWRGTGGEWKVKSGVEVG